MWFPGESFHLWECIKVYNDMQCKGFCNWIYEILPKNERKWKLGSTTWVYELGPYWGS